MVQASRQVFSNGVVLLNRKCSLRILDTLLSRNTRFSLRVMCPSSGYRPTNGHITDAHCFRIECTVDKQHIDFALDLLRRADAPEIQSIPSALRHHSKVLYLRSVCANRYIICIVSALLRCTRARHKPNSNSSRI